MTQVFFHPYLNKFYIFSIWNAFIISCFVIVQYVRSKSSWGLGDYMFNKYRAFFTKLTIKCSVYYIEAKTQYIKTGFEPLPKQNSNLATCTACHQTRTWFTMFHVRQIPKLSLSNDAVKTGWDFQFQGRSRMKINSSSSSAFWTVPKCLATLAWRKSAVEIGARSAPSCP